MTKEEKEAYTHLNKTLETTTNLDLMRAWLRLTLKYYDIK